MTRKGYLALFNRGMVFIGLAQIIELLQKNLEATLALHEPHSQLPVPQPHKNEKATVEAPREPLPPL